MKLWAVMQRIERCRYQAEQAEALARDCSPETRQILEMIERQWLELAAQAQALLYDREPGVAPVEIKVPANQP